MRKMAISISARVYHADWWCSKEKVSRISVECKARIKNKSVSGGNALVFIYNQSTIYKVVLITKVLSMHLGSGRLALW